MDSKVKQAWVDALRSGNFDTSFSRPVVDDDGNSSVMSYMLDKHARCAHRWTISVDHSESCPVYTDGAGNTECTCHYSDTNCEEVE